MNPSSQILNLASLSLKESVSRVLFDLMRIPVGEAVRTKQLALNHGLREALLKRVLNFASFSRTITWHNADSFSLDAQRPQLGATGLIRALSELSGAMDDRASADAVKLGLDLGVLVRTERGVVGNPELDPVLDPKSPKCMRSWLKNFANVSSKIFEPRYILDAMKTGHTQWSNAFGLDVDNPFDLERIDSELFENLMRAMHQANVTESEVLCNLVDLSRANSVLDIGGASGALGKSFCVRFPTITNYAIYELGKAIPLYQRIASESADGASPSIQYRPGDFFAEKENQHLFGLAESEVFDSILLGWILHDWSDEDATLILRKAKSHLKPGGDLFVIEAILPEDRLGPVTMLDLSMLMQTGGKERTLNEYRLLLDRSGLKLVDLIPSSGRRQILRACLP